MAAFMYYKAENARHADALKVMVPAEKMQALVRAMCEWKGLPSILVRINTRAKVASYYSPARREISIAPTMMDALTLAHEWAHYAHEIQWLQNEYIPAIRAGRAPAKPVVHGHEHRVLTDWAVAFIKDMLQPTLTPPPAEVKEEKLEAPVADPVKAAFEALPAILTCPCCRTPKAKAEFGVRVTKKDAQGLPLKIVRQSYCASCR